MNNESWYLTVLLYSFGTSFPNKEPPKSHINMLFPHPHTKVQQASVFNAAYLEVTGKENQPKQIPLEESSSVWKINRPCLHVVKKSRKVDL